MVSAGFAGKIDTLITKPSRSQHERKRKTKMHIFLGLWTKTYVFFRKVEVSMRKSPRPNAPQLRMRPWIGRDPAQLLVHCRPDQHRLRSVWSGRWRPTILARLRFRVCYSFLEIRMLELPCHPLCVQHGTIVGLHLWIWYFAEVQAKAKYACSNEHHLSDKDCSRFDLLIIWHRDLQPNIPHRTGK